MGLGRSSHSIAGEYTVGLSGCLVAFAIQAEWPRTRWVKESLWRRRVWVGQRDVVDGLELQADDGNRM